MRLLRTLGLNTKLVTRRRDVRISALELDASYSNHAEMRSARVKDVSPTGVYLLTGDRWDPGANISLTLTKWNVHPKPSSVSVHLIGTPVRQGKDGVGLAFLHEHIDTAAWLKLVSGALPLFGADEPLRMLRVTKALAFLCRICPAREAETVAMMFDELAYESGERALDILIEAEDLIERRGNPTRADVSPALVSSVLLQGTTAKMDWVRHHWAGLLAASSLEGANNEKSLEHAALLAKLDFVQLRILAVSCTRAASLTNQDGEITARKLSCTAEQMRKITRVDDLRQIEHDLDHLFQLGLIEKTIKLDPFASIDVANLTPTRAGLSFYAKCNGHLQAQSLSDSSRQMSLFNAGPGAPAAKKYALEPRVEVVAV